MSIYCHPGRGRRGQFLALAVGMVAMLACALSARGQVTVLVGEPFGNFGTMMPVGHTSILIDRACADGPLKVRMCRAGEPQGVVIARYHQLGQLDWIATPVMDYLYATESPQAVPAYATLENTWELRQAYRRRFLREIVPDGTEYEKATDEWWESVGNAYTRRLWGYRLATTAEQDRRVVDTLNERANRHVYRLKGKNCADFAAQILTIYFPGSVQRNKVADLGLMSPKNVARCVQDYGEAHPERNFRVLEIAQVPGSLRRSRPIRYGTEGLLKTRRYLATLLVIQPEVPLALWIMYLERGRWRIGQNALAVEPGYFAGIGEPELAQSPPEGR